MWLHHPQHVKSRRLNDWIHVAFVVKTVSQLQVLLEMIKKTQLYEAKNKRKFALEFLYLLFWYILVAYLGGT